MKIILSLTLFMASLSANAQLRAGNIAAGGALAGLRAFQAQQQEKTCRFLIEEFEKDPANRVPPSLIVDRLRTTQGISVSQPKALDIEQWLVTQRYGGGIRPMRFQLENSCRARSSTWFGGDTEDVLNLAGAETGMALVNEALHIPDLSEAEERPGSHSSGSEAADNQSCALPDSVICDVETPVNLPQEMTWISTALNTYVANQSTIIESGPCSCLIQKINHRFPDPTTRQRALTDARKSLNNIIVRDAGKKFLDSLASNYEDVNFFKNLPDSSERFSPLYCTNVQNFEEGLGEGCNVPQSVKQERLHLVFNSLGGLSDSATLSGHMQAFTQRISNMTPPGFATPYTRDQLDIRRWSLSNDNPNFRAIDSALAKMFATPVIKNRLKADIEGNEYRTPEQAILKVIMEDIQSGNTIPAYLNIAQLEPDKQTEINEALSSGDKDALGLILYNHISYVMQIHPGIARLLSDRDTFNRLKTSLPPNLTSLKAFTESQSALMAEDFQAECEQLKIKLSQLICTPQEDLIKNIDQRDLANLIRTNSPDEASSLREMNNLLMCQNPNSGSIMAFNNIRPVENYTPAKNSDYFARVNPGLQGQSTFDLLFLAERNNEDIRSEITGAVIRTEQNHRGWADHVANRYMGDQGGRISDETIARVSRETSQSSNPVTQMTQPQVTAQMLSESSEREVGSENSQEVAVPNQRVPENIVNQTVQSNYVNVPAQTTATTAVRELSSEERMAAFRERFNQEEEARLRNNLTPDQLTEIDRLREEASRDRAKLDELTNNAQIARIRQLEEQVKLLEQRRNTVRDISPDVGNSVSSSGERNASSEAQNIVSNSATALSSQIEAVTSLQRSQSVGSAVTSGASGGGNISRGIASNSNPNPPAAVVPRLGSTMTGALVITSSATRTGDVPPAELSQEVIRYLTQNNPDLAILTQIKEKGMVYKFQTMENGVVKEREVFIQFDLLTPDARREVEKQIAKKRAESTDLSAIQNELTAARRSYSYEALKLIVGQGILQQK